MIPEKAGSRSERFLRTSDGQGIQNKKSFYTDHYILLIILYANKTQ